MAVSLFRYSARSSAGEIVRGSMEAASADDVLASLRTRALFVTGIDRRAPSRLSSLASIGFGGPSHRSLLAFFRSFSTLIRAAIPMQRSLTVAIERCHDPHLRESLRSVLADVENGSALSTAMGRRAATFPPLQVAMIRAGEAGGILDDVLDRLAYFLERDAALRKKVQAALAYPAVVLTAACGLLAFLLARIVPMFADLFTSFHVRLPWSTSLLLALGAALQSPIPWLIAGSGCAAFVTAAFLVRGNERALFFLDLVRLRVPFVGPLVQKAIVARIARTLGTLLRSGLEIVTAIEAIVPIAGSPVFAQTFRNVNVALRNGESLTAPMTDARLFDPIVLALIRVGEESGLVDDMLFKIAEYFEADVETAVATLGAVIEPALIVLLGGVVGFIVFSIFIPLYSLIGSVSK